AVVDVAVLVVAFLVLIFLGVAVGSVTGLSPGLHVNNVAALLLATRGAWIGLVAILIPGAGADSLLTGTLISCFLVATAASHSVFNFIPSVFLGAPTEDTALATLPSPRRHGRDRDLARSAPARPEHDPVSSLLGTLRTPDADRHVARSVGSDPPSATRIPPLALAGGCALCPAGDRGRRGGILAPRTRRRGRRDARVRWRSEAERTAPIHDRTRRGLFVDLPPERH